MKVEFATMDQDAEGRSILEAMEVAKKAQNLDGLKKALLRAKKHKACNQEWVDGALDEVSNLQSATAAAAASEASSSEKQGGATSSVSLAEQASKQPMTVVLMA